MQMICRERTTVSKKIKIKKKVLPGLEPGLLDSKSNVLTNYTIEPFPTPGLKPGSPG